MIFRILPKERITTNTSKPVEVVFKDLSKLIGHYHGAKTKVESWHEQFLIQRILQTNSRTELIASGKILKEGSSRNNIEIVITASDNYVVVFSVIWYVINFAILMFGIYVMIKDRQFEFPFLISILFILLGYGFTTLSIQGAMDELIADIIKALK